MISQRQVEKQYNQLMKDVKTKDFYTKINLAHRVNCYTCDTCGHITKTKDVDSGVTPFTFGCEECAAPATSSFYKDIAPFQKPTIEWYRPSLKEVMKYKNSPAKLDHILNGGLDYRKCKEE